MEFLKYNDFVNEESINESNKYSVHYSDGIRGAQEFKREDQAMKFAKDLIKTNKALQFVYKVVIYIGGAFRTTWKHTLII